jgi:transposase
MTDDLAVHKSWLVVEHKRNGRRMYDEAEKADLVALCLQRGASALPLTHECVVHANEVGRWLRKH